MPCLRVGTLSSLLVLAWAGCGRAGFDLFGDTQHDATAIGTCAPGEPLVNQAAFNASPVRAESACNIDNVLTPDGQVTGLDLLFYSNESQDCVALWGEPAANSACACVGVDLGAIYPVSHFTVRATHTNLACGRACASQCDTGHNFLSYIGTALQSYTYVDETTLTSAALTDYVVPIAANARYLVVCRDGWSPDRDDVAVDHMIAYCQ